MMVIAKMINQDFRGARRANFKNNRFFIVKNPQKPAVVFFFTLFFKYFPASFICMSVFRS
jgi:hypothetical protein